MTDRDAFAERGRSLEEEYFHRKEQELVEKMKTRAADEAARRRLGEQVGVADEELLRDLQELGYTAETVMLLYLVPLIQTAGADGTISSRERELILKAARARGITQGSAADAQLVQWLEKRPSDAFFEKTLRAIGAILASRSPEEQAASQQDLLSLCTAIASASGGIVGFGAVSDEERQMLARISEEIEQARKSRS